MSKFRIRQRKNSVTSGIFDTELKTIKNKTEGINDFLCMTVIRAVLNKFFNN